MDNAQIHKMQSLRVIVERSGHVLKFLSPYSYMLNPIENAFSKIKAVARRVLSNPDNNLELNGVIQQGVNEITESDCANYFIHIMNNVAIAAVKGTFE